MSKTVSYEVCDSIGRLQIERPDRHNALGVRELSEIESYLDLIEEDKELRVLVVTGAGDKTFCAGAALDDLTAGYITPDQFQRCMNRIADLAIPTLARVNGNVFGGGTELALSCDFRVGVTATRLRVPAAAIGLCYPPAGITRFVNTLGASVARRMLVASETFEAKELYRVGFYDYLVDKETLDERVEELTLHLAALAPLATRAMKALVRQAEAAGIDSAAAEGLVMQCEQSDDLQEGFAAQREKRAPVFGGS